MSLMFLSTCIPEIDLFHVNGKPHATFRGGAYFAIYGNRNGILANQLSLFMVRSEPPRGAV